MRDKEHRPHLPALWRERKWEGRGEERRESEPLHRCRRSSVIGFPSERERTFIEEFENIWHFAESRMWVPEGTVEGFRDEGGNRGLGFLGLTWLWIRREGKSPRILSGDLGQVCGEGAWEVEHSRVWACSFLIRWLGEWGQRRSGLSPQSDFGSWISQGQQRVPLWLYVSSLFIPAH